jgi:hypothetical protein
MNIDLLLGRTVRQILMEPGEERMRFVCADGDHLDFVTNADCCSETWFADIVGVEALLGAPILLAEHVELPDPNDDRTRQEFDSAYGFRLFTAKGCCDFVYRNSSNGYYGGDCDLLVNGAGERWGNKFTLRSSIPADGARLLRAFQHD